MPDFFVGSSVDESGDFVVFGSDYMTATALISATTAAATHSMSVGSGETVTLAARGLVKGEKIDIEIDFGSSEYEVMKRVDMYGTGQLVQFNDAQNSMRVTGPIDIRINKPVTENAVKVVEF